MSDAAKSLVFWAEAYRRTCHADYANDFERNCARAWAWNIIGAACC